MLVEKGQYEALLELQENFVPCDGNHQWTEDEDMPGERYCVNCMVVDEREEGLSLITVLAWLAGVAVLVVVAWVVAC